MRSRCSPRRRRSSARRCVAQGRHDEAVRWAELSAEHAHEDDMHTQSLWRAVHASVLVRAGRARGSRALRARGGGIRRAHGRHERDRGCPRRARRRARAAREHGGGAGRALARGSSSTSGRAIWSAADRVRAQLAPLASRLRRSARLANGHLQILRGTAAPEGRDQQVGLCADGADRHGRQHHLDARVGLAAGRGQHRRRVGGQRRGARARCPSPQAGEAAAVRGAEAALDGSDELEPLSVDFTTREAGARPGASRWSRTAASRTSCSGARRS